MPLLSWNQSTFSPRVPPFSPISQFPLTTRKSQQSDDWPYELQLTSQYTYIGRLKLLGVGTQLRRLIWWIPYKVMSTTGRISVFINLSFDFTQQFRPFSSEITPKYSSFSLSSLYSTTQATIRYSEQNNTLWSYLPLHSSGNLLYYDSYTHKRKFINKKISAISSYKPAKLKVI